MSGPDRAVLLSLVVGAVGLSACGGPPPAPPPQTISLPPLSQASPTKAPIVEVVQADQAADSRGSFARSTDGATDFAAFWFDTVNAAYRGGDLARVQSLSGPECSACQDYVTRVDSVTGTGGFLTGDAFDVAGRAAVDAGDDIVVVTLGYQVNAVVVRRPGVADERVPAEPTIEIEAAVQWQDDHWVMGQIGR